MVSSKSNLPFYAILVKIIMLLYAVHFVGSSNSTSTTLKHTSQKNRTTAEKIALLESLSTKIGGTLCTYLAFKSNQYKVPRKIFAKCNAATCAWDSWQHAMSLPQTNGPLRIVLSYGHNGLGNQLWEHTIAFMVAESMGAKLFIAPVPVTLCPDHLYGKAPPCFPPHTLEGMAGMSRLLPDYFEYELLSPNSTEYRLCEAESFFLADRPRDWRNEGYRASFLSNIVALLSDPNPRCLKMLGYFQDLPLCADDARRLWTPRMISNYTYSSRPSKDDMSIYLRCIRHYHFNDLFYYENILNHTDFKRVWLFLAPECARFGPAQPILRMLRSRFNATRWGHLPVGADDTAVLLHDLSGLVLSSKLILPTSSWAFWGGLLSNASEVHVNAPPHHPVMSEAPQYVYHNDKSRQFFGRFNSTTGKIDYPQQSELKVYHNRQS